MIRNHKTPEGAQLGEMLAKWCDDAEPKARLRMPELPPRCNSCAFRRGNHVANGSPYTQMDVLKCLMEGREFNCHEPGGDGMLCMGWAMMMLAKDDANFISVPWPFSDAQGMEAGTGETALAGSTAEQRQPDPEGDAPPSSSSPVVRGAVTR